jgi:NAD(P)-dependent dehydrogenase (short-subunit alcohol dehydrogenase family)
LPGNYEKEDVIMDDSHGQLVTPFGFASTASEVLGGVDLTGKTALVTGANSGIGFETARALCEAGAAVIVAARDEEKASDAARRISGLTGTSVTTLVVDLADLDSVNKAASSVSGTLDILVNNAGVMAIPELTRTPQGHEMQQVRRGPARSLI